MPKLVLVADLTRMLEDACKLPEFIKLGVVIFKEPSDVSLPPPLMTRTGTVVPALAEIEMLPTVGEPELAKLKLPPIIACWF